MSILRFRLILFAAAGLASLSTPPAAAAQEQAAPSPEPGALGPAAVGAGAEAWEKGDYAAAVALWRTEAERGDADAQFNMGQAYRLGRGVPVDMEEADSWYLRAVGQGHIQAEDLYGPFLFDAGEFAKAGTYLLRSVARGDPRSEWVLGMMYFHGRGVEPDLLRGYALVSLAVDGGLQEARETKAEMEKRIGPARRKKALALAVEIREAPAKKRAAEQREKEAAVARWRVLAEKGDAEAQYDLARAYMDSNGVLGGRDETIAWLGKAAAQGHIKAQYTYGMGLLATRRTAEGVPWLARAAVHADPEAAHVLAVLYWDGEIVSGERVPKDPVKAYALMIRAAQFGLEKSADQLKQMKESFSPEVLEKGEKLALDMEMWGQGDGERSEALVRALSLD